MKKPKSNDKLLTDVELELMSILWKLGEGTVNAVLERLPKSRDRAKRNDDSTGILLLPFVQFDSRSRLSISVLESVMGQGYRFWF